LSTDALHKCAREKFMWEIRGYPRGKTQSAVTVRYQVRYRF
jgi:hypothetical protein